ncbi:hypothetical protein BC828DRAFT_401582 [Blastocladiella britannica]|nr:hypothetical protein BC828DRAFT_401582 [Blastocladiella britannica]
MARRTRSGDDESAGGVGPAEAAVRPITESEQYKRTSEDLSAAIQAASIQYGGITSKRYRELIKRKRMLDHEMKAQIVENTEATGIVLHQDSRLKQSWAAFSASSPVAQSLIGIKNRVAESDNLVVSWGRYFAESVQDRFGGLFEETEMAKAMTLFKGLDPTFTQDGFMREAREFILPELLEAWLAGDREELARWCSEASLRVIMSPFDELTKVGMVSDCRLVELKRVDMAAAKVLDNNIPVVVVSFETQEMLVYRDKISKEVKLGKEDVVVRCFYQVVMSIEETERDPITRGWRVLEQAKSVVGSMV